MSDTKTEVSLVDQVKELAVKQGLDNDAKVMAALYQAASIGLERGSAIWKAGINGD